MDASRSILYGASKAGLSRYLEGLDHKFRDQGLNVVTVKPGFVKTSMTAGLPTPPFAGEPDAVATLILQGIELRRPSRLRATDVAAGDVHHPPAPAGGHAQDWLLATGRLSATDPGLLGA